ncbi:DUF1488 family protein [Piscinibacter sp. XHJ-5]|uniref:DUF1488 family protein n=1 Tax=Piscinibacter sp. XHJ-5 TaxID=3037797 RepID=UPI002452FC4D|nr:DUF1488 family protein [Piscinibacter sp. XHJ-5]
MGESVRLCRVVEGVEFSIVEQAITRRVFIPGETLDAVFEADGTPSSWLSAYRNHADEIDEAAAELCRQSPGAVVIVLDPRRWERVQSTARRVLEALGGSDNPDSNLAGNTLSNVADALAAGPT